MTVSAATATYQVNIAARGATTIGTPDLTLAISDIADVPTISGPSAQLLAGTTTSFPFRLDCIVDTVLFPSGSRLTELGRLCEIERDIGAGYVSLAVGRISHASEVDGRGRVSLEVSDERWAERRTDIFRTTDTVQLHPPGLASAWIDGAAAGTATYIVKEISGDAVRIGPNDEKGPADIRQVPAGLREALASDLVAPNDQDGTAANSAGNFTALRFRYAGEDHTVIGFRQRLGFAPAGTTFFGLLDEFSPEGSGLLLNAWVYIDGHTLQVNDPVSGRFYWPGGVRLGPNVPLHIGGANGVHPGVLLQAVLDGDYGGQAVRYDATAMTAFQALPLRPVWARITESAERSAWASENIYRAFGCAPLVGTDLNLRPKELRLPQNIDPGTLTVLTAGNASDYSWQHTSSELVTFVEYRCRAARKIGNVAIHVDDRPADDYELVVVPVNVPNDNVATLGDKRQTIDTVLILDRPARWSGEVDRIIKEVALELFDVFGDGAQLGEIKVPDNAGVEVGDYVVIDHDTVQGYNVATGDRTGDRVALLTGFREFTLTSVVFGYLDLGPGSAPLAAPTLSIAQDVTEEDLVNVTVTDVLAGATATVECTAAASSPSAYDFIRSGIPNSTISFRLNASTGTAYCRGYSTAPNRIRSAYATDDVALSTRARINSARVDIVAYDGVVTWDVPAATLGMRTRYDVHDRDTDPTLGSQTDYDADDGGFTIPNLSVGKMVTVELTPYTGWSGSAVSGTAGEVTDVRAVFPRSNRGIDLRGVKFLTLAPEVTFDANGEAVVSVAGDEDVAAIYVTVGDGSAPSDPTSGANDGSLSTRQGTISTGVKITQGRDAYVKVRGADAAGNLGPVVTSQQGRRIGPFHKDTTDRSHTGDTAETTLESITIPANTLGSSGGLRLELRVDAQGAPAGSRTLRVRFNTTQVVSLNFSIANIAYFTILAFNDGATNDQHVSGYILLTNASGNQVLLVTNDLAEDTTADMDVDITVQFSDAADDLTLEMSHLALIGTD
jgi:hypothetical protein